MFRNVEGEERWRKASGTGSAIVYFYRFLSSCHKLITGWPPDRLRSIIIDLGTGIRSGCSGDKWALIHKCKLRFLALLLTVVQTRRFWYLKLKENTKLCALGVHVSDYV